MFKLSMLICLLMAVSNISSSDFSNENKKGDNMDSDYDITNTPSDDEMPNPEVNPMSSTTVKDFSSEVGNDTSMASCKHYKNGEEMDSNEFADVWQAVYYQLPDPIECFKMHIKRITDEDREAYAKKYEDLETEIDWSQCEFEIKGEADTIAARTHLLMRGENNNGVMDNYIIHRMPDANGTIPLFAFNYVSYKMYQEGADQWKVEEDLLLMRDCNEGHIIVFSRVPRQHRRDDISKALIGFGESAMNGKMACE